MNCYFGIYIASIYFLKTVLGSGKEPEAPHLSPAVLNALKTTLAPKLVPPTGPILTCLPDYDLINDECVKAVIEPAELACNGGILLDGKCEVLIDSVLSCPVGFNLKNNYCARIVETGIQFYCPKGFYDDGNSCAQSVAGEAEYLCELGELIGNECIQKMQTDHIIRSACPDQTELIEGNCWKEIETFDCTETELNPISIVGAHQEPIVNGKKVLVSKAKTGVKFRGLLGNELKVIELPPPPPPLALKPGKEMVAVTAPHPMLINVISQVCSKKVQVDALAVLSCPEDYIDSGDKCFKQLRTLPLIICVSGQLKDGVCAPMVKRVPKHPGCPKNGYMARGKCWTEEETEPVKSCPTNFTLIGDQCSGFVDEPGFECPVGLELSGNQCIGTLIRPALLLPLPEIDGKKY